MSAPKRRTPHLPRAVARDERISRRARGIVAEQWSHKPGSTFTVAELWEAARGLARVKGNGKAARGRVEGKNALYAAVAEAREVGYFAPVIDMTPDGQEVRYALNRSAAPRDGEGFVYIPWDVVRDTRMSYRERGLLAERLAHGTTLNGQTVTVHAGGLKALGRRRPDGLESTTTAFNRLLELGYATRERHRDEATGTLSWRIVFRSFVPVDNTEGPTPAPTSDDAASPQVAPTTGFPEPGFRDHRTTSGDAPEEEVFPQVAPTTGFPGDIKGSSQGSREESNHGVRSVRSAHRGDARACEAPSANEEDQREDRGEPTVTAWGVVKSLPEGMLANTTGRRSWVRREMAKAIQRMLDDGYRPGVIVRHAARLHLDADFDHLKLLDGLRGDLSRMLFWGEICGDCGRTLPEQRAACPDCNPAAAQTEDQITPEQLARILDHFGASA
jgi:hypothetical protein